MHFNDKKPTDEVIETIAGIPISDPYRYLEDGESDLVRAWSVEQNELLFQSLKKEPFAQFADELARGYQYEAFSCPVPYRGRYFYTERKPGEDQSALYVRNGIDGNPIKLIDPNGKREGNTITIDYWQPSRSGRYIAYGVSVGGAEMATLGIRDVDANRDIADTIVRCRYSKVRWLPDDSGFFYTRNPRPGTVPKNEEHMHVKVYLHLLGSDPDADELIFGEGRPKDDMIGLALSPDGRHLAITATQTWTDNDLFLYDTIAKTLTPIIEGVSAKFSPKMLDDRILCVTNYRADNFRIITATYEQLKRPLEEWSEFVAQREYMLQSVAMTKEKILIEYLVNASSRVELFDYEGVAQGEIPLPPFSSITGIGARKEESEFFYGVTSFTFPPILYRYDPTEQAYDIFRTTDNPVDPAMYEVRQEWAVSRDGTKVPYFTVFKKGLSQLGTNPLVLTGYGGFGSSQTPGFYRTWIPWIARGGVFAVANIRGGGEFGHEWHQAGTRDRKPNTFDDFIAVAEDLISKKYTNEKHIGIVGASNGGLLVSAVGVLRPTLFKAVCSKVPLTDMVRFPLFGIASRWVHEYGNPSLPDELKKILAWSPYHNVHKDIIYPSFLFTTGEKDTRVDPLHARKMAAKLQSMSPGSRTLVYTEMDAGHGPGKPISKIIEGQAFVLTFFAEELGLDL